MPRQPTVKTAALLLIQLSLRQQHPAPSFAHAARATTKNEDDNDVHERHAHLAPREYGGGLRKERYRDGIIYTRQGRRPGPGDDSPTRRRRPRPNNDKDRPKKKNKPNKKPRPTKPRPKPDRDEIKAKKKEEKRKKKQKDKEEKQKNNDNNKPDNNKPQSSSSGSSNNRPDRPSSPSGSSSSPARRALDVLSSVSKTIDEDLFLYETPLGKWLSSTIYQHEGLDKGLRVMNSQGVAGMRFYLGETDGYEHGLVNVAAFLAQSMKETIKYNACDENNWDLVGGGYPLSNACGQLGQSYQDYKCPKGQEHMECEVDPDMEIEAVTHAKWYGAPAPYFCKPKKNKDDFTGKWNHGKTCNLGWVDPPQVCDVYDGQKAGGFDNDAPGANRNGRTDVEGCCWWGRGVIQTTGICNFGKLNYYLGARAKREGRPTPYGEIDFCKDPEAICSSKKFDELKWLAGMFYWIESVQGYDVGGWNYMAELRYFVDGGLKDRRFIDAVSGIVNRGCHNPPCGTGAVDGGPERYNNFVKVLSAFKLVESKIGTVSSGTSISGGGGSRACGADHHDAAKRCDISCLTNLDCPAGNYCWAGVVCGNK